MALTADTLALLDYRRQVAELYRTVGVSTPSEDTWRAWCSGRDERFATHTESALDEEDSRRKEGIRYFDYDPAWRFVLELESVDPGELVAVHSGSGSTPLSRFGQVTLPIDEEPTLNLFRFEQYAGGVFLPFRDGTAGTSTYGGGRYLLDTPKGADLGHDGVHVTLDFNYAYHPSCVYSDRWSCPLPPRSNWFQDPVAAGEHL